jgi:hypothetical protein
MISHTLLARLKQIHILHLDALPSIGNHPAERRDATGSDHAPILATLTT